ncbi:hypothetical protein P43SY_004938 [Pythium insidiosum]|uniref:HSF-type DNA-binding domain-containing protein n=1 Tax=Pythium insidiosum TaxID=114742 RepID=A0AAD5L9A3_PYTIN|nr:hypothetical protein P43SY_004938 [Pythium insidiosum]
MSSSKDKEIAPFLKSLRHMLDHESDAILRWTPDGDAFEIHDLAALTDVVLPKYFKHAKYASFQRQLNYFHFRKRTKSRAVVCTFSNPSFRRDEPELSWRITRKRSLSESKSVATPSLRTRRLSESSVSASESPLPEDSPSAPSLDWIDVLFPSLDALTELGAEHPPRPAPPAMDYRASTHFLSL